MDDRLEVTVGAGTMMADYGAAARFPHRWTPGGVTVEADFTGGHLLHLATAGCVLNDLYREAAAPGIELKGVRVIAAGGFDTATWRSTGIDYSVEVSSDASADQLDQLFEVVDQVAEIPQAIRAGAASGGSAEQLPQAAKAVGPARGDAQLAARGSSLLELSRINMRCIAGSAYRTPVRVIYGTI